MSSLLKDKLVCLLWIGLFQKYHNTLCCPFQILHKHCFQFLLGLTITTRNQKQCLCKFWRDNKEYNLWYFWKRLMAKSVNATSFMFPLLRYIQSVTKLIETLRPKQYIVWACFYLILSKIVQNTFQWYPSPLPLSHCCTAVIRFVGSHKQHNFVKGEGFGAVLLGVPQNASFYESVSTTFLIIVACWISIIQFCSLALTSYIAVFSLGFRAGQGLFVWSLNNNRAKYNQFLKDSLTSFSFVLHILGWPSPPFWHS